ncbi:MAG: hypothetical protein KME23_08740 [Goleter apudmare HA4340-LM2]|jgi:peptide chain release factor 2|nr:hypothetical protein [Goleter apudmare HA4340-LM2]
MLTKNKCISYKFSTVVADNQPRFSDEIRIVQRVKIIFAIQPRKIKSLSHNLIREYILHPYTKVNDLRTQVETTAVAEVLHGKIDSLIKAYLQVTAKNLPN